MNKYLKIILWIIGLIILSVIIDLISIFTINRPIFAIKKDNGASVDIIYKGIFFDTYNCQEYSIPQIKKKTTKFNCAVSRINIGKLTKIVDKTKTMKNFACAEMLEQFYEDENYEYYYSCMKGKYIIAKYESGYEETVENSLKYKIITINDLDSYNIDYIKYEKNKR